MALPTEQLITIYETFSEHLSLSNMGSDILRMIQFAPLKGFAGIVDELGTLMYKALDLLGFWNSSAIGGSSTVSNGILNNAPSGSILEILRPFQETGLGIALLILGGTYMLGRSEENKDVIKNLFFIVVIVGMLPSIMSNAINIVKGTAAEFDTTSGSLGQAAVLANTTDLYVFIDDGWSNPDLSEKNRLSNFVGLDINETITDPDSADTSGVLSNKIIASTSDDTKTVEALPKESNAWIVGNLVNMLIPRYYRWSVNWIPAYITVIALLIAISISIIRVGRLGLEATFNYVLANIIAFFSLRDTKRLGTIVMQIVVGFGTIISIFVLFYMFLNYMAFIDTVSDNGWLSLFAIIGACLLLYDGPSIIQQLFGVDAGLGSAGAMVLGAGTMLAARMAMKVGSAGLKTATAGGGFLSGFFGSDGEGDSSSNSSGSDSNNNRDDKNDDSSFDSLSESDTNGDRDTNSEDKTRNTSVEDNQLQDGNDQSDDNNRNDSPIADMPQDEGTADSSGKSDRQDRNQENTANDFEGEDSNENSASKEKESSPIPKNIDSPDNLDQKQTSSPVEDMEQKAEQLKEKQDSPTSEKELGTDGESQNKNSDSIHDEEKEKAPVKPTNPLAEHADKRLRLPKQEKDNVYTRAKTGHELGTKYKEYRKERRQYNQEKFKYDKKQRAQKKNGGNK